MKRYCSHCKKHSDHKVAESKSRGRSTANPLSRFGLRRLLDRGIKRGAGNQGKFSKPPIKKWKSTGKKTTKKTDIRFTCPDCNKMSVQSSGMRTKKLELI